MYGAGSFELIKQAFQREDLERGMEALAGRPRAAFSVAKKIRGVDLAGFAQFGREFSPLAARHPAAVEEDNRQSGGDRLRGEALDGEAWAAIQGHRYNQI